MNEKRYVKLKKPIVRGQHLDTLDELRVEIVYDKGGYSFYSGNINERGIYIHFTPCHRNNGIVSQTIDGNQHNSGYKILLKELSRKSQKQIDNAAELILPYAEQLADYYSEGQHGAVYNFVMKIYKSEK